MKSKMMWQAMAIALLCTGAARAADPPKGNILRDYTDSVAPAEQQAYEAGIKRYNQCLKQHGFKYTWTAWLHQTGDTYMYSYVTDPITWASFDDMREASKACDATIYSDVNPHLKSEWSGFMQAMPELSYMPADANTKGGLIEVTTFKLKPGHTAYEAFMDAAKKITAAAAKTHWSSHYSMGQVREGGEDAPDFVLVGRYNSWAELGKDDNPPLWTMVENAYGKEAAQGIRKSLNEAIAHIESHVDSYDAELTYDGSGK